MSDCQEAFRLLTETMTAEPRDIVEKMTCLHRSFPSAGVVLMTHILLLRHHDISEGQREKMERALDHTDVAQYVGREQVRDWSWWCLPAWLP